MRPGAGYFPSLCLRLDPTVDPLLAATIFSGTQQEEWLILKISAGGELDTWLEGQVSCPTCCSIGQARTPVSRVSRRKSELKVFELTLENYSIQTWVWIHIPL